MIDFVSTRETTDQQTAACARLLSAVIAQAIKDASSPATDAEKKGNKNTCGTARSAISFLFDNDSVFPLYASLIGSSAESIRAALLEKPINSIQSKNSAYGENERRILSARLRWHRSQGYV
jgi:hypothetical protein